MGVPLNHQFLTGFFVINYPSIGVPSHLWKSPTPHGFCCYMLGQQRIDGLLWGHPRAWKAQVGKDDVAGPRPEVPSPGRLEMPMLGLKLEVGPLRLGFFFGGWNDRKEFSWVAIGWAAIGWHDWPAGFRFHPSPSPLLQGPSSIPTPLPAGSWWRQP